MVKNSENLQFWEICNFDFTIRKSGWKLVENNIPGVFQAPFSGSKKIVFHGENFENFQFWEICNFDFTNRKRRSKLVENEILNIFRAPFRAVKKIIFKISFSAPENFAGPDIDLFQRL